MNVCVVVTVAMVMLSRDIYIFPLFVMGNLLVRKYSKKQSY
jgi:hypothetical protein